MTLEGKARSLFWLLFFGGPRGRVAWAHRGLEFGETGLPATRTRSLRGQSRPRRCRHCPAATQSSRAPSTTPLSAPQAPCASLTRFLAQGPRLLPQTLLLCSSSLVPSGCHMPEHTVGVPHVCPQDTVRSSVGARSCRTILAELGRGCPLAPAGWSVL